MSGRKYPVNGKAAQAQAKFREAENDRIRKMHEDRASFRVKPLVVAVHHASREMWRTPSVIDPSSVGWE